MAGPVTTRATAAAAVIAAFVVAWTGAGVLVRRYQAQRLPAVPALESVPEPARDAIRAADAAARATPDGAHVGALGRAYYAAQLAAPAIAAFAAAEAVAPGEWTWTYHRAIALEERQDDAAEAALLRTTELAPRFGPAWYRLAERRFKQGRLDDAAAAYARAAQAPPVDPYRPPGLAARSVTPVRVYANVGLARVALEKGDRAGAVRQAEAVLAEIPRFAPAVAVLRQARGPSGDAAPAARAFAPPADPVLDETVADARHSDVLLKHAAVAQRAGDAAWRSYLMQRALTFNPQDLNVLLEAASAFEAGGRAEDALASLKRHEALAPGDHHGLVQQGRVLSELGRLDEAEAVLRRAVTVRDAAAEFNLGTVLDRRGRWDEARTHYERALAINPYHVRAMNNLGIGVDRAGQSADALRWFARALAIDPDEPEVHVNFGSALIRARRFDDARRVLDRAVALNPRSADALNNLGIVLASQGDLEGARGQFVRALEVAPRHAGARDNLARVTAALGR